MMLSHTSKAILVNYNHNPQDWWKEYGYTTTIYDRSDDGKHRIFDAETYKTKNIGNVDYDKLSYLVVNYDRLPDAFVWGKSNLFKYIGKEEFSKVAHNSAFTPLLTLTHKTYSDNEGVVCYYQDGMYFERSSIVSSYFQILPWKHVKTWQEWCDMFRIPFSTYIPFPPGGNFILTRERVHRYGRDFYDGMRKMLEYAQTPVEAQFCERSYYLLWK